jgi:transposase
MDQLTMGVRDARRLGAVEAAVKGRISNQEGAQRTGLSLRQFKRLKAKVRKDGAAGIVHGNRGRTSSRRLGEETRRAVEAFLEHGEVRFNDCHIRDLLAEKGHTVSAETVRQIRRQMGLPAKHRRRPARYHRRRLREAQRGAMVQMDGSPFSSGARARPRDGHTRNERWSRAWRPEAPSRASPSVVHRSHP